MTHFVHVRNATVAKIRKQKVYFGKCQFLYTLKVNWKSQRLDKMQIHASTVEGTAQTNLSAVLPFWTEEE